MSNHNPLLVKFDLSLPDKWYDDAKNAAIDLTNSRFPSHIGLGCNKGVREATKSSLINHAKCLARLAISNFDQSAVKNAGGNRIKLLTYPSILDIMIDRHSHLYVELAAKIVIRHAESKGYETKREIVDDNNPVLIAYPKLRDNPRRKVPHI